MPNSGISAYLALWKTQNVFSRCHKSHSRCHKYYHDAVYKNYSVTSYSFVHLARLDLLPVTESHQAYAGGPDIAI